MTLVTLCHTVTLAVQRIFSKVNFLTAGGQNVNLILTGNIQNTGGLSQANISTARWHSSFTIIILLIHHIWSTSSSYHLFTTSPLLEMWQKLTWKLKFQLQRSSEKTARSRVKSKLHNWIIDDIFIPSTKLIQYFSKNKLSFLETPIE